MIHVKNLYHSYTNDDKYSVKGITFHVEKGEIFGFLGPSGAGKSTTQNILLGLLELQKGDVVLAGEKLIKSPSQELFNQIGVSFEQSNVYGKLTGLENLEFYRNLFKVPTEDPQKLLDMVKLGEHGKKKAGAYSKGMKHRLTFARSMINHPKLWFLDEPTSGLDPATAERIINIISEKNKAGATVFLTTHNMHVADTLCDRVAFINEGEIQLIDSPRNLKLKYGKKLVDIEYRDNGVLKKETLSFVDQGDKNRIKEILDSKDMEMMHTKEATLEEIFIQVTGRGLN